MGCFSSRHATSFEKNSEHVWDLWITTGNFEGDSTKANIYLSAYGPMGTTSVEDIKLTHDDDTIEPFLEGVIDHFEVKSFLIQSMFSLLSIFIQVKIGKPAETDGKWCENEITF